jgi:hypothetical protein
MTQKHALNPVASLIISASSVKLFITGMSSSISLVTAAKSNSLKPSGVLSNLGTSSVETEVPSPVRFSPAKRRSKSPSRFFL